MPLNSLATRGASKNIRAICPDLVSTSQGEGGVDLWISLRKQMQELQQLPMQLVGAAVRHKRKAAEQEERAVEVGKSIFPRSNSNRILSSRELIILNDSNSWCFWGSCAVCRGLFAHEDRHSTDTHSIVVDYSFILNVVVSLMIHKEDRKTEESRI